MGTHVSSGAAALDVVVAAANAIRCLLGALPNNLGIELSAEWRRTEPLAIRLVAACLTGILSWPDARFYVIQNHLRSAPLALQAASCAGVSFSGARVTSAMAGKQNNAAIATTRSLDTRTKPAREAGSA